MGEASLAPTVVMKFDPNKHHRRSVRLSYFDYGTAGAYFVTVCAAHMQPVFGRIEGESVRLHPYGRIVAEQWERTAELRSEIALDEVVVMPNHFHAIVWIKGDPDPVGARLASPRTHHAPAPGEASLAPTGATPKSLGAIVGGFKSAVSRHINLHRLERNLPPVLVWQRSFYERVIRDEKERLATRRYIIENPLNWERDEHHP